MKPLIFISLIFLYNCSNGPSESRRKNGDTTQVGMTDTSKQNSIDTLPVSNLPLAFVYDNESKTYKHTGADLESIFNNNPLNMLFRDSTLIENVAYQTDHPNHVKADTAAGTKPVVIMKLPALDKANAYLFSYLNQKTDFAKPATVELQTFDLSNKLIKRLIVFDGVLGEGTSWIRESDISKSYIITIKDKYISYDEENKDPGKVISDKSFKFKYQLQPNGDICRYFDNDTGVVTVLYNDPFDIKSKFFYENGSVKNHLKNGLWQEIQQNAFGDNINSGKFIKAFGYYKNGEKDGEWLYFSLQNETDMTRPVYAQKYNVGEIVEKTETGIEEKYLLFEILKSKGLISSQ